ncbi:FlgO family outer membrane protein [Catenovulum sp. 2E275]|uniref:FlgO family outer membrane protein n=1 Tax=Catenovulum sp. 2E275 TaxID=2980497 RepID=UPI0021D27023|nr:FlgO family outer membrane protein [Catenovulum sp. 2E275]MCU4676445.1 FlgO family outer membrane protein [Catenovulum sp. 2E275]
MKNTAKFGGLITLMLAVMGCTTHSVNSYMVPQTPAGLNQNTSQPAQVSQLSIKAYSYMLADELLAPLAGKTLNGKIVVAQFVEQASRLTTQDSSQSLAGVGGQLAESFIYELNKRGYKVTDFKLRSSIQLNQQGESVWSHQLAELKQQVDAKYVVSGTLTPHENGAVVNVRMMEMANGSVLATAQGFLPDNLFWSSEKVTTRDGMLMHRGESNRVVGGNNETYF